MKYLFGLLLIILFATLGRAQDLISNSPALFNQYHSFGFEEPIMGGPRMIYHPFYNDVQMVEVDSYNYGLQMGAFENAVHPRGGSSYYDAIAWPAQNTYYFLDREGKILRQFGSTRNILRTHLTVDTNVEIITHKSRFLEQKEVMAEPWGIQSESCGKEYGSMYRVYSKIGRYGLMDTLGAIKIPMIYQQIILVDSSYLVLDSNSLWGIYNSNFERTLFPQYRKLLKINENRFVACKEKCGCVDKWGNTIVPFGYDDISFFNGRFTYLWQYEKAAQESPYKYPFLKTRKDWNFGIMNNEGEEIVPMKFQNIDLSGDGFYVYDSLDRISIFNKEGLQMTPFKYVRNQISLEKSGFYKVRVIDPNRNLKAGFVDSLGREVGEIKYDKVFGFYKGVTVVQLNHKQGLMNEEGRELTELKYDKMHLIWDQLYQVKIGKMYGLVDLEGNEVVPPIYPRLGYTQDGTSAEFLDESNKVQVTYRK